MILSHIHNRNNQKYMFSTFHRQTSSTHFNDLFGDSIDNINCDKPIMPHRGFFQRKEFKYGYYYVKNGMHYIRDRYGTDHLVMRSHICDFSGQLSYDNFPIYTGDILNDKYMVVYNWEAGGIVALGKDTKGIYSDQYRSLSYISCWSDLHITGNIFIN